MLFLIWFFSSKAQENQYFGVAHKVKPVIEPFSEDTIMAKVFTGYSDFSYQVLENANFYSAGFEYGLFISSEFGKADFSRSKFDEEAVFQYSSFVNADFENSTLKKANFIKTQFEKADFYASTFTKANFNGAQFGEVNFTNASFNSANFQHVKFNTVDFTNVDLGDSIDFRRAEFKGQVLFRNCKLPDKINFYGVSSVNPIDLRYYNDTAMIVDKNSGSRRKCKINLYGAEIDKFHFNYRDFELYFPPLVKSKAEKLNQFQKLWDSFNRKGQKSDVKTLGKYIAEFEYTYFDLETPNKAAKQAWGNFRNWLDKNWWGYGYDKEKILRNTWWIFCFFWLVNGVFFSHLFKKVYQINVPVMEIVRPYQIIRGFENSWANVSQRIFASFICTFLVFFDIRLGFDRIIYKYRVGSLYLIFQFIIGLTCLGFLANYIIG